MLAVMSVCHCSTSFAQTFLLLSMIILLTLIWSPGGASTSTSSRLKGSGDSSSQPLNRSPRSVASPFHGVGGRTSSGSSYPSSQQPPPDSLAPYTDQLPTSLVRLEVVAILGDLSKPYVALSRTLARTLNSVTAADLVSQLDFPEKNLTWQVRNFFVHDYSLHQLPTPLHQVDSSGGGSGYGSDDFDGDEFIDDYYAADDHEEARTMMMSSGGSGSGSGAGAIPRKRPRRPKVVFGPMMMPKLCQFLTETKAIAIVNLIGDVSSERLLNLVSTQAAIPLIGSSTFASPLTLHEVS